VLVKEISNEKFETKRKKFDLKKFQMIRLAMALMHNFEALLKCKLFGNSK